MIRAAARWLFMRTHRQQLIECANFARGESKSPFGNGQRDGVLIALEALELLV